MDFFSDLRSFPNMNALNCTQLKTPREPSLDSQSSLSCAELSSLWSRHSSLVIVPVILSRCRLPTFATLSDHLRKTSCPCVASPPCKPIWILSLDTKMRHHKAHLSCFSFPLAHSPALLSSVCKLYIVYFICFVFLRQWNKSSPFT